MRYLHSSGLRRGATLVESAVTLLTFFLLVMAALDLSTAVYRYHILSGAARQGARLVIVHGSLASELGSWGADTVGPVAATDTGPVVQAIAPFLYTLDPSTANITVTWIDGSNAPESRVRVTVSTTYTPIVTFVLGNQPMVLSASSTMIIAH